MDSSTISVRRALQEDERVLEAVREKSTNSSNIKAEYPVVNHLQAAGVFTYLAEDHFPFGFVTVGTCELELAEGQVFEWYLLPEYQGRALGRKLLVHGLSVLKRRLCESAMIWMPDDRVRAHKVLTLLGFEEPGAFRERNVDGDTIRERAFTRDLSDFF